MNKTGKNPSSVEGSSLTGAAAITRGVSRLLRQLDYAVITECPLANGRRADIVGLHHDGSFVLVEVKASVADFRADSKWPDYVPFCDDFYFAVAAEFPAETLPTEPGVIVADAWDGAIVREAPRARLNAARRRALTLRFARVAAKRLDRLLDPFGDTAPAR